MGYANIFIASPCRISVKSRQLVVQGKKRGGLCSRTSIPFARVAPQNGSIRCMIVTEKQYAGMRLIAGKRAPDEKPVEYIQLSFL